MEPADYRRTSFETWQTTAPGWERWRAQLAENLSPVRTWLITELAPRPGDTVLELCAGPGETGFAAAEIVGERGRLLSTDFSPEMVEMARRRGAELGLRNVDYRVIDAERIELDANSVDGVLCQSGYMLVADPAAALSETRRVLRPGGRVALSVWGEPERNPWASIAGRFLVERGHMPPPEPGAPGAFSMASEERTRELLEGAGFTAVRIEEVAVQWRLPRPRRVPAVADGRVGVTRAGHPRTPHRMRRRRSRPISQRRSLSSRPTAATSSPASLSARSPAEPASTQTKQPRRRPFLYLPVISAVERDKGG